uniref:Uncharacterized protein n=1 Tax=Romanomermis culicivorax TaxID=13658 RepID=A0A915KUF8_ROMCU
MSSKIRCSVKWDDGAGEPQCETWGVEWGVGAGGNWNGASAPAGISDFRTTKILFSERSKLKELLKNFRILKIKIKKNCTKTKN